MKRVSRFGLTPKHIGYHPYANPLAKTNWGSFAGAPRTPDPREIHYGAGKGQKRK